MFFSQESVETKTELRKEWEKTRQVYITGVDWYGFFFVVVLDYK